MSIGDAISCQSFDDLGVRSLAHILPVEQGIPLKLLAVESLLERYPDVRGKVIMFVVVRDDGRRGDRYCDKTAPP